MCLVFVAHLGRPGARRVSLEPVCEDETITPAAQIRSGLKTE